MENFVWSNNPRDVDHSEEIPDATKFQEFYDSLESSQKHSSVLKRIHRSFSLRRSTNSATMVFLGLSNAGISHAINRVLNQSIFSVGRPTQDIIECSLDIPTNSLGILNAQVKLIDTPGFGDSFNGFDPTYYATLVKYFQEQNYLPNFIILVVSITEKDLESKSGWFLALLKNIKAELSEIIDFSTHSNVVVYLTHLCSASPSIQADPSAIVKTVEEMVQEHLGIQNIPVVLGENRAEVHLRKVEEFYLLPSGGLFPRNIYCEMMKLAVSVDPVAHSLVNGMFDNFAVLETMEIEISMISVQDAQIIKSPPPVHEDLLGIDFNRQINVPLLDLTEDGAKLILDADDTDQAEAQDIQDAPGANEFAGMVQMLQTQTDLGTEVDAYFRIGEEEAFCGETSAEVFEGRCVLNQPFSDKESQSRAEELDLSVLQIQEETIVPKGRSVRSGQSPDMAEVQPARELVTTSELALDNSAVGESAFASNSNVTVEMEELVGIDFNPEINGRLLDFKEDGGQLILDADDVDQTTDSQDNQDAPEVNVFAELIQLLQAHPDLEGEVEAYFGIGAEKLSCSDISLGASEDSAALNTACSNKGSASSAEDLELSNRRIEETTVRPGISAFIEEDPAGDISTACNLGQDERAAAKSADAANNNVLSTDTENSGAPMKHELSDNEVFRVLQPEARAHEQKEQMNFIMYTVMGIGAAGLALFALKLLAFRTLSK